MISAVIPAYNEENVLEDSVRTVTSILSQLFIQEWEVIIVDDGSLDQTARIAETFTDNHHFFLERHEYNRGKGAAVRTGVSRTRGDVVLVCDADLSTPPTMVQPFLDELSRSADIVIGDRRSYLSTIERHQPFIRRIMGAVYASLARHISGVELRDFNCGFKLFRGDVARTLLAQCLSDRWTWDVEVLALAERRGLTVRALPVTWRQGDRSSVRPFSAAFESLADLFRLWCRIRF
jgi:dolichyl-phosphate beta-glucosyltransferase